MAKNKDKKKLTEDDTLETLRSLDQGSGVRLTMSVGDRTLYHFNSQLPTPEGYPEDMSVEISSVARDNDELLHELYKKTRVS